MTAPITDPHNVPHRGLITISIMLATIMQVLDTTIANVALPHMQGSLQASQDQITWVLTSYIVASAIALPLTGWMISQWGRRKVFIVSVIGFTVASGLCGLAGSLGGIVAARLLQGVFGAALVPLSQAVLLDINPPARVGQAMAIWGAGIMVGPILGPMLGGWLTENFDWRWVFFINVPVGAFALYGMLRYLPESKPNANRLDIFGFVTLSLAIGLLQLFLDRGELLDWFDSWEIKLEAAGAPSDLARRVVRLFDLDGAVGLAALGERMRLDEIELTRAFTHLGQALGLDWAQASAARIVSSDPWERLLLAGLARDFQQQRLEFLARRGGSDPRGAVAGWLEANGPRVGQFKAVIDRARHAAQPNAAMLAQIAGQARVLLGR